MMKKHISSSNIFFFEFFKMVSMFICIRYMYIFLVSHSNLFELQLEYQSRWSEFKDMRECYLNILFILINIQDDQDDVGRDIT